MLFGNQLVLGIDRDLKCAVPITAAQFKHSLVHREPELDVFPATRAPGIATMT